MPRYAGSFLSEGSRRAEYALGASASPEIAVHGRGDVYANTINFNFAEYSTGCSRAAEHLARSRFR